MIYMIPTLATLALAAGFADEAAVAGGADLIEPLLELSTSVSFAALTWYLIVIHLPRLEERYRAERQEFRQEILDKLSEIERQCSER